MFWEDADVNFTEPSSPDSEKKSLFPDLLLLFFDQRENCYRVLIYRKICGIREMKFRKIFQFTEILK